MNKSKITTKILSFVIISVFLLTAAFVMQQNITRVKAEMEPILVEINHLDFGLVFPGESLAKLFKVYFTGDSETYPEGITYSIAQHPKPKPDFIPQGDISAREYCEQNPEDLENCYLDLCDYLIKTIAEDEADIESSAFIGPNDEEDVWQVALQVPAIYNHAAQDHLGGIIERAGEYGCDISINSEYAICGNGAVEHGEECDDGNNQDGDGCSAECIFEVEESGDDNGGGGGGGSGGGTADECGDGIWNQSTEECDGEIGVTEGYYCTDLCELELIGKIEGEQTTGGQGGGETSSTQTTAPSAPVAVAPAEQTVAGETTEIPEEEILPEETPAPAETCEHCGWLEWLIVLLLFILINVLYNKLNKSEQIISEKPKTLSNTPSDVQPTDTQNKLDI